MSTHHRGEEIKTRDVLIRLRDGEIIEGRIAELDLDNPDILVNERDAGTNNRSALVPLSSVKSVVLERRDFEAPPSGNGHGPGASGFRKVVIHFWDGEIVKGLIREDVERHAHGLSLSLISPALDEEEILAIPHSAIKALFFVKSWDSRAGEYFRETGQWKLHRVDTPLIDLLGEINSLTELRQRGELTTEEFQRRRRDVLERI